MDVDQKTGVTPVVRAGEFLAGWSGGSSSENLHLLKEKLK
jgi:hypothetical protein